MGNQREDEEDNEEMREKRIRFVDNLSSGKLTDRLIWTVIMQMSLGHIWRKFKF